MTERTHHRTDATWRTGVVRARLHLRSAVTAYGINNVHDVKPGGMFACPADASTPRGAPPH